jgi:hypothetical protein
VPQHVGVAQPGVDLHGGGVAFHQLRDYVVAAASAGVGVAAVAAPAAQRSEQRQRSRSTPGASGGPTCCMRRRSQRCTARRASPAIGTERMRAPLPRRTRSSRFCAPRRTGRRSSRSSQTSSSARSPHSPSRRSTAVSRQPARVPPSARGLADEAVILRCGKRLDRAPGVLAPRPWRLQGQREPSLPLIELVVLDEEAQERVERRALLGNGKRRARLPQLPLIGGELLERQLLGPHQQAMPLAQPAMKRAQAERYVARESRAPASLRTDAPARRRARPAHG